MTEEILLLKFLSQFELTGKKVESLLVLMDKPSVDALLKMDLNMFSEAQAEEIRARASQSKIQRYLDRLEEVGVKLIVRGEKEFPSRLVGLDDAPLWLFCKGDISLFDKPSVSIVGSRSPTNYGRIVTDRLAGEIASAGATIISGLAYGVDSIAHRKALEVGGKTIAVLGGGFNHIYPAEHTTLSEEIAQKGLLVSEYCPSLKPSKFTFPQRNRIIAGLSDAVIITEAGLKSGTVHTKDFALDYGKEVFCVPGNITSDKSGLPNSLIASGQASCLIEAKQVLEVLGLSAKKKKALQLGIIEEKIVNLLKNGEKDVDFLAQELNFNVNSLNVYLTTMEINGIIRKMPGGYYSLA